MEREQLEMFEKAPPPAEGPVPIHPGVVPPSTTAKPNPNIISTLENLLGDARSGKLQGTFFVGLSNEGEIFSVTVGHVTDALLGAVERGKLELALSLSEIDLCRAR